MPLLDPEMREYETIDSLEGGKDGLDAYKAIIKSLDRLLSPDGIALVRIHAWDREVRLFRKAGFRHVEEKGNYRHNPSCVVVRGKKRSFAFECWKRASSLVGKKGALKFFLT
jgi:release factor glutamine methyltransferase